MIATAYVVAGILFCAGTTPLIDAWLRRPRRPDLAERLRPYQHRR